MTVDVDVDINVVQTLAHVNTAFGRAQKWLDNEILKDSEPFVPFDTGALTRSGQMGTVLGSGILVYNTPYAKAQYYGTGTKSRDVHAQACPQWFEKAKAIHKLKWVKGANLIARGL